MRLCYILVGQTPVEEPDPLAWAEWMQHADLQVARTRLASGILVSTVFLGVDHNIFGGSPLLFETMAFYPKSNDTERDRCSTWLEAEKMHKRMVKKMMGISSHKEANPSNLY